MSKHIKVLYVTRRFPPSTGGMENFAFDLSQELSKKVDLSLIKWGGSNRWLPLILPWIFVRSLWVLLRYPGIDVIHMQDVMLSPFGWLLSKVFRKPYFVVGHGLDITYDNWLYQKIVPFFMVRAKRLFCISTETANQAIARGAKNALFIPIGAHSPKRKQKAVKLTHEFSELKNRQILLTVGRLVERKGVDWFINNVMPSLVDVNPEILYVVVGGGEMQDQIQKSTVSNKLSSYVKLVGRVSEEEKKALYRLADLFIMPNIRIAGDMEGFGLVAHEAVLSELPVVATGIEGIKDALDDGKNGILLEEKDAKAYQERIIHFLSNPEESIKFGKKAKEYTLEKFSWGKIADDYINEYKRAIDEKSP